MKRLLVMPVGAHPDLFTCDSCLRSAWPVWYDAKRRVFGCGPCYLRAKASTPHTMQVMS